MRIRNGWGYLSRHPALGWSYVAWQKIWRLAGADHMHVNGLANKFSESDESVKDIGASLSHANVRLETVHRDAGVFFRPIGPPGSGDACRARLD